MSTKPCPHCGTAVPQAARFCGHCGTTIGQATTAPPAAAAVAEATGKTLLDPDPFGADAMMANPITERTEPPPRKTPVVPKVDMDMDEPSDEPTRIGGSLVETLAHLEKEEAQRKATDVRPPPKTMLQGSVANPDAISTAPPGPPSGSLAVTALAPTPASNKTMLGMPAKDFSTPAVGMPAPPANKTMLGVAMPGIAPVEAPLSAKPVQAPQGGGFPPPPGPPQPIDLKSRQGTILGAAAVPGLPPPQAQIVAPPTPYREEPLPDAPHLPEKSGVPAIVVVGILIAIVLVVGAVGTWFVLHSPSALIAQPQLDETGKESLRIKCDSCPDGTVLVLGASTASVTASAAVLPLPAPLSIGDNDLVVKIDRPANGRDEEVKVRVPVAYRVRADLTTLSSKPPSITVRVEAAPRTEVTVEGKPVTLDENGRGAYAIDVTAETQGPNDDQKLLERKIPFSITAKGGKAEIGQLTARSAVVPLHVDAPGRELVTDRANTPVSGQTKPGGVVTIDGQSVVLDPQGRFALRVELPASGEKTIEIVASGPPLAPRTVRSKITRVSSMADAAKEYDAKTPLAFSAFAADATANLNKEVVVDGDVVESRVTAGHTVLLVEEKKACTTAGTCLVRVVYGDELKAARGDGVRIHGRLAGTVTASGRTVPEVEGVLAIVRAGAQR